MQYDRKTATLAMNVKRSLPTHLQDAFKLSSPDLVDRVKQLYLHEKKGKTKALAAKFLTMAGVDTESVSGPKPSILTRLVRGIEVVLESEQKVSEHKASEQKASRPHTKKRTRAAKPKSVRKVSGSRVQSS